jgi:hypothetical protein
VNEELAMTVHARQLARLCRERLAAQQELPVFHQQPADTAHAADVTPDAPDASESEQPVS